MDLQTIKTFHAACYMAKRIIEFQPNLPDDLPLRAIYVIEAIHSISEKKAKHGKITVTAVARYLGVSKRNATRWTKELIKSGLVLRKEEPDGRQFFLLLTEKGEKYYADYITAFEKNMVKLFGSISKNDMQVCVSTIHQAFYLLAEKFPDFLS